MPIKNSATKGAAHHRVMAKKIAARTLDAYAGRQAILSDNRLQVHPYKPAQEKTEILGQDESHGFVIQQYESVAVRLQSVCDRVASTFELNVPPTEFTKGITISSQPWLGIDGCVPDDVGFALICDEECDPSLLEQLDQLDVTVHVHCPVGA